jgi:hypothetical protein
MDAKRLKVYEMAETKSFNIMFMPLNSISKWAWRECIGRVKAPM